MIDAEFPEKLSFLFRPARYKVAYGGRYGIKSWSFARALLILGTQRALRIPCCRETQKSIADSVHRLLCDQIELLGLSGFYRPEKARIYGANGTEFSFHGLKHNVHEIKSLEGADIFWVEEAAAVSKESWNTLLPTARKKGSEVWVSFNPELEQDDTYQRWVIHPPPGAVVVKTGWQDNPWINDTILREIEHDRETDPDKYAHVWGGNCISVLEGAIYANELRAVDAEGRITRVPYDPSKPVHTFWDLGWGDLVAIWFAQAFPFEFRLIDYMEGSQAPITEYLRRMQAKPYVYGDHWLPWDGAKKDIGTGKSPEDRMREAGRKVRIVPRLSVSDGIDAARTIFPVCWFDAERCADGIQALRRYRYGEMKTLGTPTREPLHDENSHAADAFRYFAVAIKQPKPKPEPRRFVPRVATSPHAWMG